MKNPEIVELEKEFEANIDGMSEEDIQSKQKFLDYKQKLFDEGVELAEKLSKFANSINNRDGFKGFMLGMKSQHRTLQQSSFGLFLAWSYYIANEYKTYDIDLRNSTMKETADKIKEKLGEYGNSLPFI
jgi:regulatory protein YycH of two-component signal transduction system YycFG